METRNKFLLKAGIILIALFIFAFIISLLMLDPRCGGKNKLDNGCDCNYYFNGYSGYHPLQVGQHGAAQIAQANCLATLAKQPECYDSNGNWNSEVKGVKWPVCENYYKYCIENWKGTPRYNSSDSFNCGNRPA
jgi:hypothetical protein